MKINLNNSPVKQPEGTCRFMLNAVTDSQHITSISNERGNQLCVEFDANLVGPPVLIDRDTQAVFLQDNSIWKVNTQTCTKELYCQLPEFKWDVLDYENNPVTATYRVVRGCETTIYAQDGINSDLAFNLSRPEKMKTNGVFDYSKFQFNPEIVHSTIQTEILNSGGKLQYGTYNFAIEFLNQNQDSLFITPVDINYTPIIYTDNTGALNISTNLPEVGGRPLSNRSIKLTITNIPEDAVLARIIVFRHITGDGFTSDAHVVGNLIPVNGTTIEYVYRGFSTDNGDYLVDKNAYLSVRQIYENSFGSVQVNNRLLRYNLKESVRDYSTYQSYASKICSKYVVSEISKDDPDIYLKNQTFLGGEIILPCINYVHADGTISPSFPLVGRSKNNIDEELVPDITNVESVTINITNVNVSSNQATPWSVAFDYTFTNTVGNWFLETEDNGVVRHTIPANQSGSYYHATHYTYPDLYLVTPTGRFFIGGISSNITFEFVISNSSFPKWQIQDTAIKDNIALSGFKSSGQFGYYEIPQKYTNPVNYCGTDYWGKDCDNNSLMDTPVRLFVVPDRSNEAIVVNDNIRPIGIKFSNIEYPSDNIVSHYFSIAIVNNSNIVEKGIVFKTQQNLEPFYYNGISNNLLLNFVNNKTLIQNEYFTGEYVLQEGLYKTNYLQGYFEFDNFANGLPYNQLNIYKQNTDVYAYQTSTPILNGVEEVLHILPRNNVFDVGNLSVSNPFCIINPVGNPLDEFSYTSVRNIGSPITNIWATTFRRITNLGDTISYKGGYFLSPLMVDNIAELSILTRDLVDVVTFSDTEVNMWYETLTGFVIESKVNGYLRHEGTDKCNSLYKGTSNNGNSAEVYSTAINKVVERYEDKYKIRDSICPFFPGYNSDYSYVQELNKYGTIGLTFDFCSECTGLYPHRIIFSPQSFSEDLSDGYRINLPNDYIDIPSNTGSIIAVDFRDNKLVVRTERSTYFLQPNPQQMETSESNVYIGTGDFLSIPAQELNISQPGYGGQQGKLDSLNFEKGLVWADRQRGDIYLLGGQFSELNNDMSKWFYDNLNLNKLVMSYDPFYDRLMVTCKNNWTLSYCFKHNGWKSWHSYIPQFYSFNHNEMYSVHDKKLWSHNSDKYTVFYDIEFPCVKEFIINNQGITFRPQSIQYHANAYNFTNGYEEDVLDVTYDEFIAYSDRQITGVQKLRLNDEMSVFFDNSVTDVKQTDRNYKISPLKDLATSSNIWTMNITPIKVGTQGYMDKLPVFNSTLAQVSQADFRGKWVGVRLITNNHDYKLSLEWADSLKLNSFR